MFFCVLDQQRQFLASLELGAQGGGQKGTELSNKWMMEGVQRAVWAHRRVADPAAPRELDLRDLSGGQGLPGQVREGWTVSGRKIADGPALILERDGPRARPELHRSWKPDSRQ